MTEHDDRDDEDSLVSSRPLFAPIPEDMLLDMALSSSAVRLWGILDRTAQRDRIFPGQERLADQLGTTRQTIGKWMAELVDGGWMSVKRRGLGRTNVYTLHDRRLDADPSEHLEVTPALPLDVTPSEHLVVTPALREERGSKKREVDSESKRTRARRNSIVVAGVPTPDATVGGDDPDAVFDQFWKAYPRKVAKPVARKAFAKALAKADVRAIGAGLKVWRAYWTERGEPEFVPHPATWLNQERWNDEPPQPAKPKTAKSKYDPVAAVAAGARILSGVPSYDPDAIDTESWEAS